MQFLKRGVYYSWVYLGINISSNLCWNSWNCQYYRKIMQEPIQNLPVYCFPWLFYVAWTICSATQWWNLVVFLTMSSIKPNCKPLKSTLDDKEMGTQVYYLKKTLNLRPKAECMIMCCNKSDPTLNLIKQYITSQCAFVMPILPGI